MGQTGLFSCAMKHDCGLQCRCNSKDVTPYIIVINRCWALLGYIICFVPDTHASQMLSTRIKAGGVHGIPGAGRSHRVRLSPCTDTKSQGRDGGSLARDAVLWSKHSCCVVCAALELAGNSHTWVAHMVTSAQWEPWLE